MANVNGVAYLASKCAQLRAFSPTAISRSISQGAGEIKGHRPDLPRRLTRHPARQPAGREVGACYELWFVAARFAAERVCQVDGRSGRRALATALRSLAAARPQRAGGALVPGQSPAFREFRLTADPFSSRQADFWRKQMSTSDRCDRRQRPLRDGRRAVVIEYLKRPDAFILGEPDGRKVVFLVCHGGHRLVLRPSSTSAPTFIVKSPATSSRSRSSAVACSRRSTSWAHRRRTSSRPTCHRPDTSFGNESSPDVSIAGPVSRRRSPRSSLMPPKGRRDASRRLLRQHGRSDRLRAESNAYQSAWASTSMYDHLQKRSWREAEIVMPVGLGCGHRLRLLAGGG